MRMSPDHYKEGRLIDGFDYINQSWVKEGRYITCGHPETMTCDCYGRIHHGETTQPGRLDGSEPEDTAVTLCRELLPAFDKHEAMKAQAIEVIKEVGPETPLGQGARIALHDLTEKEKAFDWKEVDKASETVDKVKNFNAYLDAREAELSDEVDYFVRLISKPGNDTPENLRHRLTLLARLTEIRRTIQELDKPYSPDMETDYSGELLEQ